MKPFLFKIRFAFKNIIKNPGRSVVVFLTLILAMSLFTLIFGISDGLYQIFTHKYSDPYLNVDFTLTYDSNSEARIVNKRRITQEYAEYYSFAACFFNFYSLTTVDEEAFYSQVFSASIVDLENVIDINLDTIQEGEVFITRSLAEKYQLSLGDPLHIFVAGNELVLTVKTIIDDRGLFTGDSLFVEKVSLMEWLYSIPGLTNLGNIIYFDLKDSVDPDDFISALAADPEYDDFIAAPIVNAANIQTMTDNTSALLIGVGIVTLVALLLVLDSIFPLLFQDFRQQMGIIKVLGGDQGFSLSLWLIQFFLYSMLAIPVGLVAAWGVLNGAAATMEVTSEILVEADIVLMAIGAFTVFIGAEIWLRFRRMMRQSAVSLSYDRRHALAGNGLIWMGLSTVLLVAQSLIHPFSEGVDALLCLLFGIVFAFCLTDLLTRGAGLLFSKGVKRSVFSLFGARNLKNNRIIRNSIRVAMISIIVIVLNLTIRAFTLMETEATYDSVDTDFFLTNIVDGTAEVKNDILTTEGVDSAQEAIVYRNIFMQFSEEDDSQRRRAVFFFCLPYEKIPDYFNLEFDSGIAEKFADTQTPYIALAKGVGKIFGIEVGDTVTVEISREIPEMTFIVAGFIDTDYMGMVFSNLMNLEAYRDEGLENTILIRSSAGETLKTDLMKAYSARMYFLIDTQEMVQESTEQLALMLDFISFLVYAVAAAFIVIIINNSLLMFYSLKADYARIRILGLSRKEIFGQILREVLMTTFAAALGSFIGMLIITPNLGPLMLLARFYKDIRADVVSILLYTLAGTSVFLLSYVFYLRKINRLDVIQEIKTY